MAAANLVGVHHLQHLCSAAALRHGVAPDVHPEDFISQFVVDHPSMPAPKDGVDYYFDDGATSARRLAALLDELGGLPSPYTLLEFASGFGCVTRHLGEALPEAIVTSCDIHPQAVEFVEQRLGVPTLLSHATPELLVAPSSFDCVFALSFFSHMPRSTWTRWLRALLGLLSERGLLVFTTHGRASMGVLGNPPLSAEGFWFHPSSEQGDLDPDEYGSTITTPEFVFREAAALGLDARIVHFREAAWWGHQDVYVMARR